MIRFLGFFKGVGNGLVGFRGQERHNNNGDGGEHKAGNHFIHLRPFAFLR